MSIVNSLTYSLPYALKVNPDLLTTDLKYCFKEISVDDRKKFIKLNRAGKIAYVFTLLKDYEMLSAVTVKTIDNSEIDYVLGKYKEFFTLTRVGRSTSFVASTYDALQKLINTTYFFEDIDNLVKFIQRVKKSILRTNRQDSLFLFKPLADFIDSETFESLLVDTTNILVLQSQL